MTATPKHYQLKQFLRPTRTHNQLTCITIMILMKNATLPVAPFPRVFLKEYGQQPTLKFHKFMLTIHLYIG